MANLYTMLEKRHPRPGWQLLFEVSNGTGYRSETRYADAVAFGIWPSHGHELHGFEIKASRTDLQKELSDPRKADAIGQYCDYWWLVLEDYKICEGIVIPPTWGILAPRGQILKVYRKAPKRKAKPLDRSLAAALIRRVTEQWVPKHVHEEFKKNAHALARKEIESERKYARESEALDYKNLLATVQRFEELSGVKLTHEYDGHVWDDDKGESVEFKSMVANSAWQIEGIAAAVKIVTEMRAQLGRRGQDDELEHLIENEINRVEQGIGHYETMIGNRRGVRDNLRYMLETERKRRECQSGLVSTPDGPTSPAPSDGDDHQGSRVDRGNTGASEQDAGVQLRDQRAEVPPGQGAAQDPGLDL